jgi:Right handed beta helix region
MTYYPVMNPYQLFTDDDGQPLENGYIYIGEANLNPITNPIVVTWDEDGLYPAAQPIRTEGGYPQRNGTAAKIYVNLSMYADYSIIIKNKYFSTVHYIRAAIDSSISNNIASVDTIAELRLIPSGLNPLYIRGHSTIGDGGQGTFEWFDGAVPGTYVDDNGTIIVPTGGDGSGAWLRQLIDTATPLMYGAKFDGSSPTITTSAIQKCIDNNDSIFIPAGIYTINAEITITSNKSIILDDNAEIKGDNGFMTSGTGKSIIIFGLNAQNINIKNGTINGNSTNAADLIIWPNTAGSSVSPFSRAVNLIVLQSNDNITIDNVHFLNSIGTSIKEYGILGINPGTYQVFKNCYFDNILGNCIDGNMENLEVSGNTVNLIGDIRGTGAGGTKGGLVVVAAKNAIITGNKINQTTDSSIYVTNTDSENIIISNNYIKYSGKDAIKLLESAHNGVIDGNIVITSGKSCIGVYDDGVTDKGHTTITNNIIGYINTPTDILDPLASYAAKTITGCHNQSSLWVGTFETPCIGTAASNVTVIGNKISNAYGFVFNPTEQNFICCNNIILNATGPAIRLQSTEFTISDNIFENVGSNSSYAYSGQIYGIYLVNGTGIKGIIANNVFKTTGSDAIYADSNTTNIIIKNNYIYDWKGTAGIYINGAANPGTVKRLNISDNIMIGTNTAIRAIYLRNIDDSVICGNIINIASDGIRVNACGDLIISNNRLTNMTTDGIYIDGSTVSVVLIGNSIDTAVRAVTTHSSTNKVTAFGNIGTNCSTSTVSIAGTTIRPTTISIADANI